MGHGRQLTSSSTSLNDVVAALNQTFAQADPPHPLPEELTRILSSYIARQKKEGDGLHDELRQVYRNHVEAHANKLPSFMAVLKVMRAGMIKHDYWFHTAVEAFVDQPNFSRSAMADAQDFVLDTLSYEADLPDAREKSRLSCHLCAIIIQAFVNRTNPASDDALIRAQDQAARQLLDMVVAFARKNPRDFYTSVDDFLLKPATRLHALELLAAYLEQQHAHLYLILETTVVEHLLKCLLNDTATIIVSAALRCLIMLIPHIPVTVSSQLPRLFLIYSRCLCWEKFSASSTKAQRDLVTDDRVRHDSGSDTDLDSDDGADPTWQVLRTLPDMPESSAPELLHYFTYLYGLYPLNFLSYVRKPRKYLKNIDFPGADEFDLDQTVIRSRTEQFQRVHLLHPSLFTTTVEEELSDNRWLKAEPSEVIAECHSLYAGEHSILGSPGPPPSTKLPALPTLFSADSNTPALDSPTVPEFKSEKPLDPDVEANTPENNLYLQRQLSLLRNELTFERYLKQQHVAAIGQLKRNHIKAVTVEAETATLINANRALHKRLSDSNKFNDKMQKETQARRVHTKQSEEQLMAKIRTLKAELEDQETLRLQLSQASKDCDQLRQLLVESEARESGKQEQIETFEMRLKEHDSLQQTNLDLQKEVRTYRDQAVTLESVQAEHELAKQELESTKFILQRREQELEQLKHAHEAKIQEFDMRLKEAMDLPSTEQPVPVSVAHLHDQLSDLRVKHAQARAAYSQLLEEFKGYREVPHASDATSDYPVRPRSREASRQADFMNQEASSRSYSPAGSRLAYYTDRGMDQFEMFAPHMDFGRTYSPVSSLNQSYPPARPLRPEAYHQKIVNSNPMSRSAGTYFPEHALHPATAHGAARSNFGSEQSSPPPSMIRDDSRSAFSLQSEDAADVSKDKSKSKPEFRVYGRGK